jgi:hypothetical protein
MEPNNQAQRLWGEVLAAVSRVFVNLMQAVAISTAKATPESKVEKITEYLRAEWSTHLEFLEKVAPAARNRGMLLYIGTNQAVYAGDNLWGRSFNPLYGSQLRLATAISRADIGKAAPPIQTFCVGTSQDVYHGRLEWSATGLQRSLLTVKDAAHPLTNCRDIWAAPGDKPEEVCFYAVHVDDVRGYLLGGDNQARFVWSEPIKDRRPASIRVVGLPESIPNDPDGLDQTTPVLNDIDWIVYVGCEASADIFVKASDQRKGYLPIPPSWTSYTGIGIDQTYLWIFRPLEFACVTHTSLIQCLRKNRAQPSWITNFPRQILYSGAEFTGPPGHKGLLDLFPCEDGTLIVAAEQRRWTGPYRGRLPEWDYADANILAIGDYHTDLASKAMSVTWRTVENNQALQVHKVPIPCWPLIEGTIQSLKRKLTPATMTEGSRGGG